jgi:peptide/nickel transport system substrate-binding protein
MPYNHDIKKAKQLLAEAGYPNGFDVELACLNYSPWIEVALKIKSDLAEVGVNVKINPMTVSRLYDEVTAPRKFQMYMWEFSPDYVDPDSNAKVFAHCDSLGDDATIKLMAWEAKYMDLERSKLIEQAAREQDRERREAIYKQVTDTVLEDGPFVLLYTPIKQYGVRSEVKNFVGTSTILWSFFPKLK